MEGHMGQRFGRRGVLGLLAAAAAGPARGQSFKDKQLVSQGFGGPTQDVLQRIVFDSLDAALGCHSTQVPLQSAAAFSRMRAEAAAPQIDMYQFSGGQEVLAAGGGLSADLGTLSNLADVPAKFRDPGNKWVTFAVIAEGILYRTD